MMDENEYLNLTVDMRHTLGDCPYCGAKIWFYSEDRIQYGSPVRVCKKCKKTYHDRRYREPALTDTYQEKLKAKTPLMSMLAYLSAAIVCYAVNWADLEYRGRYFIILYVAIPFLAAYAFYCLGDFLWIISGKKKKYYDRLRKESYERISRPEYVELLSKLGYPFT